MQQTDMQQPYGETRKKPAGKIMQFFGKLATYDLAHRCEISLDLYADDQSEQAECSHQISGSGRHNLLRMLTVAGLIAVALNAVCALCACLKGHR